jgi:hypothetical protein
MFQAIMGHFLVLLGINLVITVLNFKKLLLKTLISLKTKFAIKKLIIQLLISRYHQI